MSKIRTIQPSSRQYLSVGLVVIFFIIACIIYTGKDQIEKISAVSLNVPQDKTIFNNATGEINTSLQRKLNLELIHNLQLKYRASHSSPALKKLSKKELEVKKRLEERRHHIHEICSKMNHNNCGFNLTLHRVVRKFYEQDTTVCTVFKAGSSTWHAHLRRVNKNLRRNSRNNDEIWEAFLSQPRDVVLKDILASNKIITVRNPLTRLVSAYRDKFKDGRTFSEYKSHEKGRAPTWNMTFFRFLLPALFLSGQLPSDTHFKVDMKWNPVESEVRYSLEEYHKLHSVLQPVQVSFEQFLRFVIYQYEKGYPDVHWMLYHTSCCPCYFDYDYITKIETLSEDLEYVFKVLGIPADPERVKHKRRTNVEDNVLKDLKYYKDVPLSLKKELYKWIKTDMDLFQYELPKNFLS